MAKDGQERELRSSLRLRVAAPDERLSRSSLGPVPPTRPSFKHRPLPQSTGRVSATPAEILSHLPGPREAAEDEQVEWQRRKIQAAWRAQSRGWPGLLVLAVSQQSGLQSPPSVPATERQRLRGDVFVMGPVRSVFNNCLWATSSGGPGPHKLMSASGQTEMRQSGFLIASPACPALTAVT
ncbi:unnamed protein product [Pleuronectes platessa]|uniref:Uncharacterized protein n=1 Tax=Pleuronectes platessa TaxID=8262 RepID=A0A9N7YBU5_PLEPL|nr:unnamed protein product [Pleuronectes platessa]